MYPDGPSSDWIPSTSSCLHSPATKGTAQSPLCPSGLGTATALCLLHAKLCRVSSLIALPQTRPGTLVQFPLVKTARCWKTPIFLFHSHSLFFIMRKPEDLGIPTHSSTEPSHRQHGNTQRRNSNKEERQEREARETRSRVTVLTNHRREGLLPSSPSQPS